VVTRGRFLRSSGGLGAVSQRPRHPNAQLRARRRPRKPRRVRRELRRLLEVLEEQRTGNLHPGFAEVADRRIMLMGYSRGGILARQVLVDLKATDAPVLRRISNCIELHAPNQGSNLGNVAAAVDGAVTALRAAIDALVIPPPAKNVALGWLAQFLDWLHADLGAHGDYAVGSQVLRELAEAEPVSGVEYYTFGGTRPVLLNVRGWAFTPGSALPQWHEPPFHWRSAYQALLPIPPPLPLPVPEPGGATADATFGPSRAQTARGCSTSKGACDQLSARIWPRIQQARDAGLGVTIHVVEEGGEYGIAEIREVVSTCAPTGSGTRSSPPATRS
jgi:hypothetical protein